MKKVTILAVAMLSLSASLALAGGVNISIGDCGSGTLSNAATNTCASNTGSIFAAYGSVVIPAVTKSSFVGSMSIIDIQTNDATIPDYWRADACRSTAFSLSADGSISTTTCAATLWDTATPAGSNITALSNSTQASIPLNRERLLLGSVLFPTDVYNLTGDNSTEMVVFKLTVGKAKSVGTGACTGCATGACIVLNEIQLQGMNDNGQQDYLHITQTLNNNHISYNASAGLPTCPDAVPVRNRTWGSVKALYR